MSRAEIGRGTRVQLLEICRATSVRIVSWLRKSSTDGGRNNGEDSAIVSIMLAIDRVGAVLFGDPAPEQFKQTSSAVVYVAQPQVIFD